MRYIILALLFLFGCKSLPPKKRIAILTPASHPSLEQIALGFKKELNDNYQIIEFNAHGNKTLMRSEVEEIAHQNFDLLLTIGKSASHMAAELFLKRGIKIPIVFTSVNDPSTLPKEGNMTGVEELLDLKQEVEALLQFKPSIQTILLVYNPEEPGLQKDAEELNRLLKEKGIKLMSVEVFRTSEIKAKAASRLQRPMRSSC